MESVGDKKDVDVAFGKGVEVGVGKSLCLIASVGESVCVSVMEVFVLSILPIDVAGVINLNFLDEFRKFYRNINFQKIANFANFVSFVKNEKIEKCFNSTVWRSLGAIGIDSVSFDTFRSLSTYFIFF